MPRKSRGSSFPCSTPGARLPCAAACRQECGCIPATTLTIPISFSAMNRAIAMRSWGSSMLSPLPLPLLCRRWTPGRARYTRILAPTVPLARHIFQSPTSFYKTGVVFLAYLNGYQEHFRMVGGLETGRSLVHLAQLFVLADEAGLLRDPALASERMRRVLPLEGGR